LPNLFPKSFNQKVKVQIVVENDTVSTYVFTAYWSAMIQMKRGHEKGGIPGLSIWKNTKSLWFEHVSLPFA